MNPQTLAQRRAAHALRCVEEHAQRNRNQNQPDYGNYVSYVETLPATILMNGLGQAAATLISKAEGDLRKPHGLLYADLQSWLCGTDEAAPYRGAGNLMQAITCGNETAYLHAQAEALAWLVWLKKFANAYLKKGENP